MSLLRRKKFFLIVVGIFFVCQMYFLVCAPFVSCQETLKEKSLRHKVRSIQYWGNTWKNKPLAQRLAKAPDELIEKLRLDNQLDGFSEIPVGAEPPPEFFAAIKQVEGSLPGPVALLAQDRIIGIFAVKNLGGSGYVESVLDEKGAEKYAFIVLDGDVLLARKANEWATWKERSLFKPVSDKPVELKVTIEKGDEDNAQNAVVYILLHEIGHFMGMASCAHSSWTHKKMIATPFSRLSWKNKDGKIKSIYDRVFPERQHLKPYAFDRSSLTEDQIIKIYRTLNTKTNFPTIHATADVWEDFAESFVTYIHVVREKRPYEIRIRRMHRPDIVYTSCWANSRCKDKRAFMDHWFSDPFSYAPESCR